MKKHYTILVGIIFLAGFLLLGRFSVASASTLLLNPPFATIDQNQDLKVDIVVNGTGEIIDGVDAILNYDSSKLSVKSLTAGKFFGKYPLLKNENSQIKVVALAPTDGVKILGDIVVASVDFEVIDSGSAKLDFVFSPGATTDSNAPSHTTSLDSLTAATGGSYSVTASPQKIKEAQAKKALQPPSPFIVFIIIIILLAVGIWYYLRHRKPKEDVFTPEPFPLDKPPKVE